MSDSERAHSGVGRPVEISPHGPLGSDRVAFHAYSGGSAYHQMYIKQTSLLVVQSLASFDVTKPLLQTSQTALDTPIRFLLRCPNRCQDRCSLRCSFPENLITCIITCIPHVTHHVQSSLDSRLSCFHEVSELLSQLPPVSIRKTYSHMHNSRATQ